MKLDGWNYIPRGYGLAWDLQRAPLWLRAWFAVPVLDRFAYPVLVRRRIAFLTPQPAWSDADREPVRQGGKSDRAPKCRSVGASNPE